MGDDAERTKQRIKGWLLASNWKVDDAKAEKAFWGLYAEFGDGPNVHILQLGRDEVLVGSSFALSESQIKKWAQLDPDQRLRHRWELQIKLLETSCEFEIRGELETFAFHERIYGDALTKDRFWQRLRKTRNAAMLIGTFLGMILGEPFPYNEDFVN